MFWVDDSRRTPTIGQSKPRRKVRKIARDQRDRMRRGTNQRGRADVPFGSIAPDQCSRRLRQMSALPPINRDAFISNHKLASLPGLDPAIHPASKDFLRSRWMRGSGRAHDADENMIQPNRDAL